MSFNPLFLTVMAYTYIMAVKGQRTHAVRWSLDFEET